MDPGTTLAVVSLVYDVTKDLYKFYRGWKDCDDDVAELRRQLLELHSMFRVLRHTLQRHDIDPEKLQLVYDAIGNCNDVANDLRNHLQKFPSIDEAASMREKMRAQGRRLFYPFKQSTVMALQEDLQSCRDGLRGAVGVINLGATLGISQLLKDVDKRLVESSERFEGAMDQLSERFGRVMLTLTASVNQSHSAVDGLRVALEMKERQRMIQEWLCPTDYSKHHNDYYANRSPDTGEWIFTSPEFVRWSQDPSVVLFCAGDPGVGKTIMAATVIQQLLKSHDVTSVATIFVYFNYKRESEQNTTHVVCALLRQLIYAQDIVPESLGTLYDYCSRRQIRPSQREIEKEVFTSISTFEKVNIVIDALDECPELIREDIIAILKGMHALSSVHILFTSRPLPDIESHIDKYFEKVSNLKIRASDYDLTSYLQARQREFPKAVQSSPQLQERIVTTIVTKVNGIKKTPKALKAALERLEMQTDIEVDIYDRAYDGAIERILEQSRDSRVVAFEALAWITKSQRPLTFVELEYALAIELDDTVHDLDEENIVPYSEIFSCCAGLATYDAATGIVRLVHFTAQQYLERKLAEGLQDTPAPDCDTVIALKCLKYLSFGAVVSEPCADYVDLEMRLARHPFLEYAATYWGPHIRAFESREREQKDLDHVASAAALFLEHGNVVEISAQILLRSLWGRRQEPTQPSHLLAHFGLVRIMEYMAARGLEMDAGNSDGQTPLSLAAESGHEETVRLLLATNKVAIDSADAILGQTPLSWAAKNGHEAVVRILIDADPGGVNRVDSAGHGMTPLSWAATHGHPAVVKLLLATTRVNVEHTNNFGRTPLSQAAGEGHVAVMQILLAAGAASIDLCCNNGQTPLSWAASNGHEDAVRALLATGKPSLDLPDNSGQTPLAHAAAHGHGAIVELLLATGQVDVDACDIYGGTPFFRAVRFGHLAIVQRLLATGKVDSTYRDKSGRTAFAEAVERGHADVVKFLLGTGTEGLEVDARDHAGYTPLSLAAANGHETIVELLLATDRVDVNARGHLGRTPLSCAAMWNRLEVVQQLLSAARPVDVNSRDDQGRTALSLAAEDGHIRVVQALLHATDRIDANLADNDNRTRLVWAAMRGHEEIVKLLDSFSTTRRADGTSCDLAANPAADAL